MTSEEYFDTLARVRSFPTVPALYRRLETALADPDTDLDTVADLVGQDPVLASRLIRIANSAFFGPREKVTSVRKAVTLLGLRLVQSLCLATGVMASFPGTRKNTDRTDLWRHSVGVAACCRLLGRDYALSADQTEEIHTAAVLHDLGKIVTEQYFPRHYDAIINLLDASPSLRFWEAERRIIGLTHAEAGSWVLRNWNFDHRIVAVVNYHHAVEAGFTFCSERERLFLSLVVLSDHLVKSLGYGSSGDRLIDPPPPQVLDFLELTPSRVDAYRRDLAARLDDIEELFSGHL